MPLPPPRHAILNRDSCRLTARASGGHGSVTVVLENLVEAPSPFPVAFDHRAPLYEGSAEPSPVRRSEALDDECRMYMSYIALNPVRRRWCSLGAQFQAVNSEVRDTLALLRKLRCAAPLSEAGALGATLATHVVRAFFYVWSSLAFTHQVRGTSHAHITGMVLRAKWNAVQDVFVLVFFALQAYA